MVIDEAASLGNKANESKNPEIVDTIIELADSTSISRVKAQKSLKRKAGKTHSNARLALYMCAQTGEVVTQAFEGRKKQGIRERLRRRIQPTYRTRGDTAYSSPDEDAPRRQSGKTHRVVELEGADDDDGGSQ